MTFHPKQFYRILDDLLHQIEKGRPNEDWYARLVVDIVESFGDELLIENGRVYTESSDGFRLDADFHSHDPDARGIVLRWDYKPLELILEHGVYLFDETVEGQSAELEERLSGLNSAGILIRDEPRRLLGFAATRTRYTLGSLGNSSAIRSGQSVHA